MKGIRMEKDSGKKKNRLRVFGIAAAVLVIAAVAAVLIVCRGDLSAAGLRDGLRTLTGGSPLAETYSYDGGEGCLVRVLDESLAVVNTTGAQVFGRDGAMLFSCSLEMSTPAVAACGNYAVVYDVGGTALAAFTSEKVTAMLPAEGKIISASVNSTGWFAVCMTENTYTSSVTVYNPEGTAVYRWYAADGYAAAAAVTEKGGTLAVAVYDVGGTVVVCMDLDSTDEVSRTELAGTAVLDLWWSGTDALAAATDAGFTALDRTGRVTAQVPAEAACLLSYARMDGATAFVSADYEGSTDAVLWTVSDDGRLLGTAAIKTPDAPVSAAGRYIAVLCADTVEVYNKHVQQQSVYTGADGAASAAVLRNGTALAAGGYYAWLLDSADRQ